MKSSIDKLPELVDLLKKEDVTPNKIAMQLKSDRRTVDRMLAITTEMNIIGCKSMEISGRNYRVCGLTPEFKKFLKEVNE
jgi:predicted transcriptional regulator